MGNVALMSKPGGMVNTEVLKKTSTVSSETDVTSIAAWTGRMTQNTTIHHQWGLNHQGPLHTRHKDPRKLSLQVMQVQLRK